MRSARCCAKTVCCSSVVSFSTLPICSRRRHARPCCCGRNRWRTSPRHGQAGGAAPDSGPIGAGSYCSDSPGIRDGIFRRNAGDWKSCLTGSARSSFDLAKRPAGPRSTWRNQRDAGSVSEINRAVALHQQGRLMKWHSSMTYPRRGSGPGRVLNLLGLARYQQGRNAEALRLIGAALARAYKSADIIKNFAPVLAALGRQEEALAHFRRRSPSPRRRQCARQSRHTLKCLKRDEEAIRRQCAAPDRQPHHLGAMNESGGLNTRLARPEAALAHYDRALAIASAAELYVNKGTALRALTAMMKRWKFCRRGSRAAGLRRSSLERGTVRLVSDFATGRATTNGAGARRTGPDDSATLRRRRGGAGGRSQARPCCCTRSRVLATRSSSRATHGLSPSAVRLSYSNASRSSKVCCRISMAPRT